MLLEKEKEMRVDDGLGVGVCSGRDRKVEVVQNIRVEDKNEKDKDEEIPETPTEVESPERTEEPLRLPTTTHDRLSTTAEGPPHLGIDDSFRREIIEWMLDVGILDFVMYFVFAHSLYIGFAAPSNITRLQ